MNNYFGKIYCINLDERSDRWEKVKKKFESVGLTNYTRFSAIKTGDGWNGCKQSHLTIIKEAKDKGYKNFLVFEDDFILHKDFNHILNESISSLPNDWDMLYLGGNLLKCTQQEDVSSTLIKVNSVLTTHCYMMRNTLYDKVLNEAPDFPRQHGFLRGQAIDVYYSEFICKTHNVYMTSPSICGQEEGYSDIEKKNMNYNHLMK
jgi:glycosyl transferase family 25